MSDKMLQKATFAAGCFWCVEPVFTHLDGVIDTKVGYIGGHTLNPTYQTVCTHTTGHAEAVEVVFNPAVISYEQLVTLFFEHHDPTTLNRQGPDIGDQYRSAIFYHSTEQQQIAKIIVEKISKEKRFNNPIVTEITPASTFWPAEDYHQRYFEKRQQRH